MRPARNSYVILIIGIILLSHSMKSQNIESETNQAFKAPVPTHNPTQKNTPMAFLPKDNGKTRFYVENGMFRERTHDNGDNLWRTSLAYIAYQQPILLKGMLSCTRWEKKNRVRYFRSVEQDDETVSRDQITMFLVAMAEGGGDVRKYVKATPWRISKKYTLTPDMWLWMRALGGSKIAKPLFYLMEIPIAKFYQLWNTRKNPKGRFPSYALHLLAWQVYSLKDNSVMDQKLKNIILKMTPENNLLLHFLMGESLSQASIDAVVAKTDFQWQRDSYSKPIIRPLTAEEAEYNTLDVDILQKLFDEGTKRSQN